MKIKNKKLKQVDQDLIDALEERMIELDSIPEHFEDYVLMVRCYLDGHVIVTGNRKNRWVSAHPCANWRHIVRDFGEILK